MEEKDRRPYFVLTNEYPRHRKIRPLSDKAFRLHVCLMALCNEERNDGLIYEQDLYDKGKSVGQELIKAGLVHDAGEGQYQMHDYLRHQNSALEIAEKSKDKQERGSRGGVQSAHNRWHVKRDKFDPNCELCVPLTG